MRDWRTLTRERGTELDEFLRQAMRERNWSIPRFAEACDVNPGLVARWVSKNPRYRVIPGPASCQKIAAALDMDVDDVLELAGHRMPQPEVAGSMVRVDAELDSHLARYGAVLSRSPRVIWRAVLEANEAMARALVAALPPVSDSKEGGVSAHDDAQTRGDHGGDAGLTVLKLRPSALPRLVVLARA